MSVVKVEELEGDIVTSLDHFFVKIGKPLQLNSNDSNFDLKIPPSQPLLISQRFRLTFVAYSSGFYVVKTKDLIDSAKGSVSSVQELSLVDVSIGRVRILALSTDNSTLAASVDGDIRFYSVDTFLNKEVKQSFSCSLNDSTFVKDMRWTTTSDNSYIVLSNTGQLYHGGAGFPLKHVMDNVEAVDWCVKGTLIAVARKNVLSILSTKFEERVSISLPFRSWIGDSEGNVSVKVDSVKCVRPDAIVIGCFQLTEDGQEENYLIQVISSKLGEISDDCSELVVQSFYDNYPSLVDDIVSPGSGPYLSLAYLEQCQLVINANMKNTDDHICLLAWSQDDDKGEPAIVNKLQIDRLKWIPKIELQANDDDNHVLGLCIDKVSIYQKVGVKVGAMEEETELLPYCVLMCLTLDGKLVLFHVASPAGSKVSAAVDSAEHDEEDASVKLPEDVSSTFSHGLQKREQELDQDVEVYENLKQKVSENLKQKVSENLKSKPFAEEMKPSLIYTKYPEVGSATNVQSLKSDVLQIVPGVDVKQVNDSQISRSPSEQSNNLGQKNAALETSIGSFTVNRQYAAPGFSSYKIFQDNTERTKEFQNTNSSQDSEGANHLLPRGTFSFPKNSNLSSVGGSRNIIGTDHQNKNYTVGATNAHAANISGSIGGKPFFVKDANVESPRMSSAGRPVQSGGQLPSIGAESAHLSLHGNSTTGKSSIQKFHPSDEQHVNSSKAAISSSDLSKQFGNINEMTKELDLLLKSIEEAGGFRDACTRSLQSSIEEVEQNLDSLSKRCKIRTCQVDQHLEEVHYLLNKTIQVVARKVYMEDIYKQACDSRYWDLWNRQKLNSELDLKRKHIFSLNQDLTYQLVELERHFNALELNKFNQFGGHHIGRVASQNRYGPSRHVQSLHSLQNAIRSQLVAAENLSEHLSKQMATLSLSSPSEEQKNVKELFETIGIPYDASFGSPDTKAFMKTPSSKKLLFSDLTSNKDKSKRIQASAMKSCEPETARRRRDSLDQSWTCSEPPKTIIKRMLLQDLQKPKWKESSSSKEKIKTSMPVESSPHQMDASIPSASFLDSHLAHKDVQGHSKAIYDGNLKAHTQVSDPKSRVVQRSNISAVPQRPAFQLSPAIVHGHSTETRDLAAEKLNVQKFDTSSNSESKPFSFTEMPQKFSFSTRSTTETPLSLFKLSEMPITNSKMTAATSLTMGDKLSGAFTPESWKKNIPSSESHSSSTSATSNMVGKVAEFNFNKSWPENNIPAVPKSSDSLESLLPPSKTPSVSSASSSVSSISVSPVAVSVTLSNTMPSSNVGVNSNHMPTSSATGFLDFSNVVPKQTLSPSPNPPSLNSTLELPKSEIQPAAIPNLKTNSDAATEVVSQLNEPLNGESESKLGSSINFSPTNEQPSGNIRSSDISVVSVSQSERPSDAPLQLSSSFLTSANVSSGKNGGLDVGLSQEDEMEEEAPETSNSTELSFGNLGGFGIGSTPNPSVPKSNPFGGSFNNVATSFSSSTNTLSVPSGELFRPASFTFPSSQSSAPTQSTNSGAFSGGFGVGAAVPAQAPNAFGQPAQVGQGKQVLGSVLGSFGQSRQLGSGFASPPGFGSGFAASNNTGGFSNAAVGGFAGRTSAGGGGFAAVASTTGGGFANVTSTGSGFSGFAGAAPAAGGFGSAAPAGGGFGGAGFGGGFGAPSSGGFGGAGSGGGFGAFSSQGSGGFSAFSNAGGNKPPELFTQMRK